MNLGHIIESKIDTNFKMMDESICYYSGVTICPDSVLIPF